MAFDVRKKLVDEGEEVDEPATRRYIDELVRQFVDSPEGGALVEQGVEPGQHLDMFLDYLVRWTGANPAEMDAGDVGASLDVMAEKITARPEDLDNAIPELEAFCDFMARAFGLRQAAQWKLEIQRRAPDFRRAIRDPSKWGMAKSMMMRGLARGYDLSTEAGINEWLFTYQAEQVADLAAKGAEEAQRQRPGRPGALAGGVAGALDAIHRRLLGPGPRDAGPARHEPPGTSSGETGVPPRPSPDRARAQRERARRKQARASRRQNRR